MVEPKSKQHISYTYFGSKNYSSTTASAAFGRPARSSSFHGPQSMKLAYRVDPRGREYSSFSMDEYESDINYSYPSKEPWALDSPTTPLPSSRTPPTPHSGLKPLTQHRYDPRDKQDHSMSLSMSMSPTSPPLSYSSSPPPQPPPPTHRSSTYPRSSTSSSSSSSQRRQHSVLSMVSAPSSSSSSMSPPPQLSQSCTIYVCNWPGCGLTLDSTRGLKTHIKTHAIDQVQRHLQSVKPTGDLQTRDAYGSQQGREDDDDPHSTSPSSPTSQTPEEQDQDHSLADNESQTSSSAETAAAAAVSSTSSNSAYGRQSRQRLPCTWPGCEKILSTPKSFKDHLQIHAERESGLELPCPVEGCNKVFQTFRCMRAHQLRCNQVKSGKRLPCPIEGCSQDFGSTDYVRRHVLDHEKGLIGMEFICDFGECQVVLSNPLTLQRHKQLHLEQSLGIEWKCLVRGCGRASSGSKQLIDHQARVHKDLKDRDMSFDCPYKTCLEKFTAQRSAYKHECLYKQLKCPVEGCQCSPSSEASLEAHLWMHKNLKTRPPYPCFEEGCSEVFDTKEGILNHSLSHTPAKNKK
ncbi:hypothetical protein BGZ83_010340 [Gryganskiella cystojenkinii]|nr:hypothetical protein BGZ83_010340 [Gryganskiella cystojenkinii]